MSVTVWMPKIDVGEGLDPYKIDVGEGLGPQNRCRSAFEFSKIDVGEGLGPQDRGWLEFPKSGTLFAIDFGNSNHPDIDLGDPNHPRHRFWKFKC